MIARSSFCIKNVSFMMYLLSIVHGVGASAQEKVLIITHSFNRPEFIEIQQRTFKKFLKDAYEFVVFNDANTVGMAQEIDGACARHGISCIRIPQEIHDRPYLKRAPGDLYHRPNIRHANVLQYSLDTLGFAYDGIVAIIDSDMFLVKSLSIHEHMKQYDLLSVHRGGPNGIVYLWPGLVFFNMNTISDKKSINFNCGYIKGHRVDSGGYMHYFFEKNPAVKVAWVSELQGGHLFCPDRFMSVPGSAPSQAEMQQLANMGFDETQIDFLQQKPDTIGFLCDHHFLHYRAGSNYDNKSDGYLAHKWQLINKYLDTILAD